MTRMFVLLLALLTLAACGPAVGEVRSLARPPKPEGCPLELVEVGPADMQPGAAFGADGQFEQIGIVSIGASVDTDAMSDEIRNIVKPRACAMGGDAVSLLASGTGANRRGYAQQNIAFIVWGRRMEKAAPPRDF